MSNASMSLQMSKRGSITIPKPLRDSCGLRAGATFTLLDLDGVFILSPRRSEIDAIADKIAAQWAEDGETLETMFETLREERDRHRNQGLSGRNR